MDINLFDDATLGLLRIGDGAGLKVLEALRVSRFDVEVFIWEGGMPGSGNAPQAFFWYMGFSPSVV